MYLIRHSQYDAVSLRYFMIATGLTRGPPLYHTQTRNYVPVRPLLVIILRYSYSCELDPFLLLLSLFLHTYIHTCGQLHLPPIFISYF